MKCEASHGKSRDWPYVLYIYKPVTKMERFQKVSFELIGISPFMFLYRPAYKAGQKYSKPSPTYQT